MSRLKSSTNQNIPILYYTKNIYHSVLFIYLFIYSRKIITFNSGEKGEKD